MPCQPHGGNRGGAGGRAGGAGRGAAAFGASVGTVWAGNLDLVPRRLAEAWEDDIGRALGFLHAGKR